MAYYANGKLPCLALIARGVRSGVRFPPDAGYAWRASWCCPGTFKLVADLFPAPAGTTVPLVILRTEFDIRSSNAELSNWWDEAISRLETMKQIEADSRGGWQQRSGATAAQP
jgi:hypothetical protein